MEFSTTTTPTLPLLSLSEDEQRTIRLLQAQYQRTRFAMELANAYYVGTQTIDNLRISVPEALEQKLRTIVGWPAMAVDPYVERLNLDAFRQADATDGDEALMELMDANGFEALQPMAYTDALSLGRAYWMWGTNPLGADAPPVLSVESPLNMAVLWDMRGTSPRAALQEYHSPEDNRRRGAFVLPGKTVQLAVNDKAEWEVVERDEHDFDFVPIVRMAHGARTNNRDGRSAITPAMMSVTDSACRTLMSLEVAREIYSVPQMIILGAAEDAFQKSDGTPKTAWETYIQTVLALEADANGVLPEIKQKQAYDPSTYTKVLDWYASSMAGMVAAPPQDMGLYTQGNPASAEAGVVSESRRDRRAVSIQRQFSPDLIRVAQMGMRFKNGGTLPAEYERLATDWDDVTMATPAVTSDAVTKEINAKAIPATSDVTLKRLGYSAVERKRLAQDRAADDSRQLKMALVNGMVPQQQTQQEPTGGNADGL